MDRSEGGIRGSSVERAEARPAAGLTGGDLLERAIWIAAEAHSGQIDKAGAPYIRHVKRVSQALTGPEDRIVGALHDVLEDCPDWNEARLREEGFSTAVINAVVALTRMPEESYGAFIERVAVNPIARRVKLADLADNTDLSRLPSPGPRDFQRLRKYSLAITRLSSEVLNSIPSEASAGNPATDEPNTSLHSEEKEETR